MDYIQESTKMKIRNGKQIASSGQCIRWFNRLPALNAENIWITRIKSLHRIQKMGTYICNDVNAISREKNT